MGQLLIGMAGGTKAKQSLGRTATIEAANWIDQTETKGYYSYDVQDADVTANCFIGGFFTTGDLTIGANAISSRGDTHTGYFTIYSTTKPLVDYPMNYTITIWE